MLKNEGKIRRVFSVFFKDFFFRLFGILKFENILRGQAENIPVEDLALSVSEKKPHPRNLSVYMGK